MSIRQHTSAYVSIRQRTELRKQRANTRRAAEMHFVWQYLYVCPSKASKTSTWNEKAAREHNARRRDVLQKRERGKKK
jgi:hypothetical protein